MSRFYPVYPIVGVGGVILEGDRILLIRRAQDPGRGRWSIPGGLVNLGEDIRSAVVREVFEETGLTIEVGDLVGVFDYIERDDLGRVVFHFVIVDFFASSFSGVPRAQSDALELGWFTFDDCSNLSLTSSTRSLIRKIEKRL